MYLKVKQFSAEKPILFGQTAVRTPFSVVLKGEDVLPNADSRKLVPEGSFIVGIGNTVRFLPRTRLKTATATNSPTITLHSPSFQFKVGDVLYAVAGYATVTITGTPAAGDVYSIRIGNTTYSVTAPASPTPSTVAAAFVTANASALLTAGVTVTQVGSTGTLLFRANDAYPISTHSSNGAVHLVVTTTDPGYLGDHIVPLGTILSIAAPNAQGERVVTLAANAAYALPAKSPVGVHVDEFLGIYPNNLDFTEVPMEHIAPIAEADGVYEQNLPYIDLQIKRKLSDLRIYKRFYRNA